MIITSITYNSFILAWNFEYKKLEIYFNHYNSKNNYNNMDNWLNSHKQYIIITKNFMKFRNKMK